MAMHLQNYDKILRLIGENEGNNLNYEKNDKNFLIGKFTEIFSLILSEFDVKNIFLRILIFKFSQF